MTLFLAHATSAHQQFANFNSDKCDSTPQQYSVLLNKPLVSQDEDLIHLRLYFGRAITKACERTGRQTMCM